MTTFFLMFLSVFSINIAYTFYVKAVQADKTIAAGLWAASINLVAGLSAIAYINDHSLLIPSCLGAFSGTIAGMLIDKRVL